MAITDAQKEKLNKMCPAAKDTGLGDLIRGAETGGVTVDAATLQNEDGVLSIAEGGVGATQLATGATTNDKLATDVKVGSLAALTTDAKDSFSAALNEVDGHADAATTAAATKYTKPAEGIPTGDLAAAVQASLGKADSALQEIQFETASPVNAVAASGTLTLSGVVIDGETVTVGADAYEFAADAAQSVAAGRIAVDITAHAAKAAGTLTMDTQPASGDTMTLGTKLYTFVPVGTATADGEIAIGADLAGAQAAIVAAINGTDGVNTAHPLVSAAAFAANDCVITALVGGTAGNAIASVESFTAGTNAFDAVTLGTTTVGTACSAANAVTALVGAITASATELVSAADGANDTAVVTAATKGAAANAIITQATMANGAWGAGTLAGGVDGTAGVEWQSYVDAAYLYVCIAANTVADTNWRRVSLGTAY